MYERTLRVATKEPEGKATYAVNVCYIYNGMLKFYSATERWVLKRYFDVTDGK